MQIHESVYIADGAKVMGDVSIGEGSSVWFNSVIRGDGGGTIAIGQRTNIQDGSMVHTDPGFPVVIGDDVTVGHGCILHGCIIEDGSLIGMGAILLNGSIIRKGAIVAAGSLVPQGMEVPAGMMAMGSPAVVRRPLRDSEVTLAAHSSEEYLVITQQYRDADQSYDSLYP